MIQLQLPSGCYLLVEVPEGSRELKIFKANFSTHLLYRGKEFNSMPQKIELPKGQWSIIGKADELKESDCEIIVEPLHQIVITYWKDYRERGKVCFNSKDSLLSLIASHNKKPETTLILKNIQP